MLAMKNRIKLVFVLVALLTWAITGSYSCRQTSEKQGEKAMEEMIEQGGNTNADVDIEENKVTIESDQGKVEISNTGEETWPDDIPDIVPELKTGKITGITRSNAEGVKNWMVRYNEVPIEELDKYNATLKAKGFKTMTMKTGKGGMVNGEKDKLLVILTVAPEMSAISIAENND